MELILWRHAEAEDAYPDLDRVLTAKGRKQAEKMAAWLKARIPGNTRILVSPAKRTQQTANALELDFSTLDALAPGAYPQALLQAAGWPNAEGAVLIVGHQPTLGMVAAYAMTGQAFGWSVKKGAVWWISGRLRAGEEQAVLRAALSPDLI
jgi:phosphohistidine phosphatase